jgi:hypothetical protein
MGSRRIVIRTCAALILACSVGLLAPAVRPVDAASPDPADDPARVSLSDLRPRPSTAAADVGRPYRDGCHVPQAVTRALHCVYGRSTGTRVVVVVGDSIAAQWWAAIDGAARTAGWRVVWMTKSACTAADVTIRRSGTRYHQCDTWRRNALAKVRNLPRVDLLLLSGSHSAAMLGRRTGALITGSAAQRAEWQAGYRRVVDRVAGQVRRVVILRDTPTFPSAVPRCLAAHGGWTRSCSVLRSSGLPSTRWAAEVAVDAAYGWVRATDMADRLCQPTRCWPVTSGRLLRYRDNHHLTNAYARAMASAMYSRLRWLMR